MKSNFKESLKNLHRALSQGSKHSAGLFKENRRFNIKTSELHDYVLISFLTSHWDENALLTVITSPKERFGWLAMNNGTYIVDGKNIKARADWFKEQPLNLGDYFENIGDPLDTEVDLFSTVHPRVAEILPILNHLVKEVIGGENGKV